MGKIAINGKNIKELKLNGKKLKEIMINGRKITLVDKGFENYFSTIKPETYKIEKNENGVISKKHISDNFYSMNYKYYFKLIKNSNTNYSMELWDNENNSKLCDVYKNWKNGSVSFYRILNNGKYIFYTTSYEQGKQYPYASIINIFDKNGEKIKTKEVARFKEYNKAFELNKLNMSLFLESYNGNTFVYLYNYEKGNVSFSQLDNDLNDYGFSSNIGWNGTLEYSTKNFGIIWKDENDYTLITDDGNTDINLDVQPDGEKYVTSSINEKYDEFTMVNASNYGKNNQQIIFNYYKKESDIFKLVYKNKITNSFNITVNDLKNNIINFQKYILLKNIDNSGLLIAFDKESGNITDLSNSSNDEIISVSIKEVENND